MPKASWLFLFAFIMLTSPDNKPVYVSTDHIASVSAAIGADPAARSDIVLDSGTHIFVREFPGQVIDHVRHD